MTITLLSLEVGYLLDEDDTCAETKPTMQTVLEDEFGGEPPEHWTLEHSYSPPTLTEDDSWVARCIQDYINMALPYNTIEVTEDDLLVLAPLRFFKMNAAQAGQQQAQGNKHKGFDLQTLTGSFGTRCKQNGREWINSRSYLLTFEDGRPWPDDRVPREAAVYATLTWRCWPK